MPDELATSEREDLRREVGRLRSGVLLSAWTVAALNEGANEPESESLRFELAEGQSFVLELLADKLTDLYGKLNEE
jgi:hypothetical protein